MLLALILAGIGVAEPGAKAIELKLLPVGDGTDYALSVRACEGELCRLRITWLLGREVKAGVILDFALKKQQFSENLTADQQGSWSWTSGSDKLEARSIKLDDRQLGILVSLNGHHQLWVAHDEKVTLAFDAPEGTLTEKGQGQLELKSAKGKLQVLKWNDKTWKLEPAAATSKPAASRP